MGAKVLIDNFKTVSDVWEEHSSSWKRAKNINKDVRFAYSTTKNISKVLNSFKYDKFKINCRVKESDIDDLEMIRERLESFTLKVHDEAEGTIDNIFNIEVIRLLEYLYSFNPGEITLSYGSKTNLASMIGVVTIDKDLRDSFLSKVNELDNDEMSNDLKSIFADSIRRYYDDGAYAAKMVKSSSEFTRDRDLLIEYYETLNPEDKKNMDKLFDGMIKDGNFDNDISNLKFIVYTADEPYKSVFLKYLPDMEIGTHDLPDNGSATQSYSPSKKKMTLDFDNTDGNNTPNITGVNNPRGPYVTFFHECGHAIDDLAMKDSEEKVNRHTSSFEYDGKLFQDVIKEDIHNFISEVAEDCIRKDSNFKGLSEREIKDNSKVIANQMMKAGNDISTLHQDMQNVYNDARNEIGYYSFRIRNGKYEHRYKTGNKYNLRGADNGGFSDLLGGITDNTVSGDYNHRKKNTELDKLDYVNDYASDYHYWYDEEGKITCKQEREAFAHLFSYGMTNSNKAQDIISDLMPFSEKFFDKMVEELAHE